MANKLNSQDEDFMNALIKATIPKNVAKTLVFISTLDETTSIEIEGSTGLRQPEVSISVQELRNRGWVTKRDIKKEGKGRPVHYYKLQKTISEIIAEIVKLNEQKIDDIKNNIDTLKKIGSSRGK
ncbi:MAG: ArsR family transcriptional regulator [Candidatus Thermoplasmatota archaeon]|jgi:predicted transcriptional regulator|nr:ArsR family transcriptional regulator [Candidatus Thermoplasmatota archaeon]MCL5963638.1 ArsR family transcriptional regulator [Candidatus Thermoplasmatota archaeon]